MVTFRLIEVDEQRIVYWYFPEGKEEKGHGIIIVDRLQDEIAITEVAPEDIERDKYAAPFILPMIEATYGRPNEMYSTLGIELLQREIELFKKDIQYDDICREIDEDMKRLGLRK